MEFPVNGRIALKLGLRWHLINTLRTLTIGESVSFTLAVALLFGTRLTLRLLPWHWWKGAVRTRTSGRGSTLSQLPPQRVRWATAAAARIVPGTTCLHQALTARSLLALAGYPSTLTLGVRMLPTGRPQAHAWVYSEGQAVSGSASAGSFRKLRGPVQRGAPAKSMSMLLDALATRDPTSAAMPDEVRKLAQRHGAPGS